MSVLVKGMKMPKSCLDCPMVFNVFYCKAVTPWKIIPDKTSTKIDVNGIHITRPDWCPLVALPETCDTCKHNQSMEQEGEE